MTVDTGQFKALTDEVAVLRDQVAELRDRNVRIVANVAKLMAWTGLLGDGPGRQPAVAARCPRHLRLVGDAS
jgi:hypothetical protein